MDEFPCVGHGGFLLDLLDNGGFGVGRGGQVHVVVDGVHGGWVEIAASGESGGKEHST